jgi:tungstate transport system substrate-binding protein
VRRRRSLFAAVGALALLAALPVAAAERFITVASTTSTEQSGLFRHLLPVFRQKTGIEVRVVAVGTGQAIKLAEKGDADVLLVHHKPSEEKFVAEGYAARRLPVMYNDFIVVGAAADPAKVGGMKDTAAAFRKIAGAKAPFASRGDKSGTHLAELECWKAAGVDVAAASGQWYRETGSGMGPTLNIAAGMDAYALADRGTWLSFTNRRTLSIVVEGDPKLFNQYGVMAVSKARHPHVKDQDGQAFVDWLVSPEGQKAIADYKINGQQLFFPNAGQPGA